MSSSTKRGAFTGVANIVRFNWPFYLGALAAALVALGLADLAALPGIVRGLGVLAGGLALFYLLGSLVVSWWIYDHSPLLRGEWLRSLLAPSIRTAAPVLINLHAGFDESSPVLQRLFPDARLLIYDFYDPARMPEPSIARARRHLPPLEGTVAVTPGHLPARGDFADAVLAILAAHEMRLPEDRALFFREIHRILEPGGRFVLVEHLRDLPNFIAFGPGFFHFQPRALWLRETAAAGLQLEQALSITPFVAVLVFTK